MKQKVVGIVIFPEVEVLDFCGPYEVFSVVRLNEERRREETSPFKVLLVAEQAEAVTTPRRLMATALAPCRIPGAGYPGARPGLGGRGGKSTIRG